MTVLDRVQILARLPLYRMIIMIAFTPNNFVTEIEQLCHSKNMEYIDAVVHWCEQNNIEIEYAASFIKKDPVFKFKIQEEAENLNFMKRSARLPL